MKSKRNTDAHLPDCPGPNDLIETPSIGDRPAQQLTRQLLAEVIEPRVEELFSLAQAELRRSGFEDLISSGIVLDRRNLQNGRHG